MKLGGGLAIMVIGMLKQDSPETTLVPFLGPILTNTLGLTSSAALGVPIGHGRAVNTGLFNHLCGGGYCGRYMRKKVDPIRCMFLA